MTLDLDGFHKVDFPFKYPEISFFPNTLDQEARHELPDVIENGILKRMLVPIFNVVNNIVRESIRYFTNVGYVGPKGDCKGALV